MKNFEELKHAVNNNIPLVWNDTYAIEGNDYTITFIEPLDEIDDHEDPRGFPILIQYGGSEAQVFLHEIILK